MDERYGRQMVIPEVGAAGQARLRQARVLVVGGGGLGSPVLLYLAAAGVGTLGVADGDHVSLSNLNRQILYKTEDVGRSKSLAAAQRARELNPEVKAIPYETRLLRDNGPALVCQYDLVVEASDNLETKDLLNELCVAAALPLVWGAVERCEGQMGVVLPGHACRHCLFPRTPEPGTYPSPAERGVIGAAAGVIGAAAGVIGAAAGVIGSLQALEAIKVLLGIGEPLVDQILLWDGLSNSFDIVQVRRNPHCAVCGATKE